MKILNDALSRVAPLYNNSSLAGVISPIARKVSSLAAYIPFTAPATLQNNIKPLALCSLVPAIVGIIVYYVFYKNHVRQAERASQDNPQQPQAPISQAIVPIQESPQGIDYFSGLPAEILNIIIFECHLSAADIDNVAHCAQRLRDIVQTFKLTVNIPRCGLVDFPNIAPYTCVLRLADNQLTYIPDAAENLSLLRELDLRRNLFHDFPMPICQLRNLSKLILNGNGLQSLPAEISQLIGLEELSLMANRLSDLPESFALLRRLQKLYLNGNEFSAVPVSICELIGLTELYLVDNQLREIPHSIAQLQNLRTLSLGQNKLKTLSNSIGQLINLVFLDIRTNQLETIPESIGLLKNLKTLHLKNNSLRDLPASLGSLTKLFMLNVSENRLTTIPEALGALPHCMIVRIPQYAPLPDQAVSVASVRALSTIDRFLGLISSYF